MAIETKMTMKNQNYLILLLIISVAGLSTGFYLKFIKSYTDERFQIATTNDVERSPNLGQTINFLEELNTITGPAVNDQNDVALKKLKTINLTSIIVVIISILVAIGTAQKLLRRKIV